MGRHCILHIGTEKTGTTSLQARLSGGRSALDAQGVRYCRALGDPAHRSLAVYAMDMDQAKDDAFQDRRIATLEDHARYCRELEAAFAAEIAEFPEAALWIISSEHLQSRLPRAEQVQRVKAFLAPYFDRFTVYLHLRPQIDMSVSLASTLARVGGAVTTEFFERVAPTSRYYDYWGLFQAWADVFGTGNLRCIAFRREPDMAARWQVDFDLRMPDAAPGRRLNSALDVRVIALVNAMARSGVRVRIPTEFLDALPVQERLSPDRALAQAIQARFDADNARLIGHCTDLQPGDLTPDWSRYPQAGNLDLLEAPCAFGGELAQLLSVYTAALERQRRPE